MSDIELAYLANERSHHAITACVRMLAGLVTVGAITADEGFRIADTMDVDWQPEERAITTALKIVLDGGLLPPLSKPTVF
jgi:hypothetical protein